MSFDEARAHWEDAAPGWARWNTTIAAWLAPATERMLDMARVGGGHRVLDVACGAGSQTLRAAERVTARGQVVAIDIAETMLQYVGVNARQSGLSHVETRRGAAEAVDLPAESFDAAICQLGLMLFSAPAAGLAAMRRALKSGGTAAAVVFTTPSANAFLAKPMEILLRHAGKSPPEPGRPGIFALGSPGALVRLFEEAGFVDLEEAIVPLTLRVPSAAEALTMMQEAFGAYRAVVADCSESVQAAAWADVAATLGPFQTAIGFAAPAEVVVAAGRKPSSPSTGP